jgi:CubicO group peptidase (beta-lactamase class C family)
MAPKACMKLFTNCICILLIASVSLRSAKGAERPQLKEDTQVVEDLRHFLEELSSKKEFSGAVLLAKGDQILFEEPYGSSGAEKNTLDTEFSLASVTKVFTAVAVLQLAQAGRFSLDDRLIAVMPTYPNKENGNKITIRHLLNHQAGLGNLFQKFAGADFENSPKAESFLALFAGDPLLFEPGTKTSYSNGGPLILGLIIEHVTGRSYEDYVGEHIFRSAGLKKSRFSEGKTRGLNAIGGGLSTVRDLLRFSSSIQNRKLLNEEYAGLILSGGAGMTLETINQTSVVGHIGSAPGMSTSFDIYPEQRYTAVALSTTDGAALLVRDRLRQNLTRR